MHRQYRFLKPMKVARNISRLAAVLILLTGSVSAQYFTIDRFHADIDIDANSSFTVKETIEVTFERQRHGIYREIPYKYVDELGRTTRMPLEVLSVTDGRGSDRSYKVSRQGNAVNIRIGHPDRYVDGRQTYVIVYRVKNGLLFLNDRDELYWNITGNDWQAPILHASAIISLPRGVSSPQYWVACYTGASGSHDAECDAVGFDNRAEFVCRTRLRSGEGFTVAYGFAKGLISEPSAWQRFIWDMNLGETWVLIIPVVIFFLMFFLWRRKGRDPKVREAITVVYKPVEFNGRPLTAAETGTLVDEKLDARDITASIIGLAAKGYLVIEEVEIEGMISLFDRTDYKLTRVKAADSDLTPFESSLLASLFTGGKSELMIAELKNKFYKKLPTLKSTLYQQLVDKKYFRVSPERVRGQYIGLGVVILFLGVFITFALAADAWIFNIIATVLSAFVIIAFSNAMPARTRSGALAHMQTLGFQEFMDRVEKDKLERLGEKDVFFKYLPYAIALDVADNWAGAFEGMYQEPPQWYRSRHGMTAFSTAAFSRSLTAATTRMSSAMYSSPRGGSGGSGGGGSSGGGGGGGGGGSW